MEVVSVSPLRTAQLEWQPRRGTFALTVVCKATYRLAPMTAELAPEQEYPNEDENHWNDDPARSLYSPCDLVPLKPRAEVLLVGHAFAPRNERVRSLTARLFVGEVDKSIEVFPERSFGLDGALREGPPFTRIPLRYERAAGGPETTNPVGVRPDARDAHGAVALPSLQAPGLTVTSPNDFIAPIGFGPIAAGWATRQGRLGRHAGAWSERALADSPLPEHIDPQYFMAAPLDQQLDALRPNERLVLENLHADYPRLVTSLTGIEPRAFVDRPGAPVKELALTADTLWIDTDRSLCTLTWRGTLPLDHAHQAGRVVVAMAEIGRPLAWADVEPLTRQPRQRPSAVAADERAPLDPEDITNLRAKSRARAGGGVGPLSVATERQRGEEATHHDAAPPTQKPPEARASSPSGLPFVDLDWEGRQGIERGAARARAPVAPARVGLDDLRARPGQTIDIPTNLVEQVVAFAAAERAAKSAAAKPSEPSGIVDELSQGDASPAWLRGPRPPGPPVPVAVPPPVRPPPSPMGLGAPPPLPPRPSQIPAPIPAKSFATSWASPGPGLPEARPPLPPSPPPEVRPLGPRLLDAHPTSLPLPPSPNMVPAAPTFSAPPVPPAGATAASGWTVGAAAVARAAVAAPPPAPSDPGVRPPPASAEAIKHGAAAASNAAAQGSGPSVESASAAAAQGPAARPKGREPIDLLWFDPEAPGRVRGARQFREILAPAKGSDAWITGEAPARDAQAERDRRDVLRVLGRAQMLDASQIGAALEEAFDEEGAFTAPLAVATGELAFRFDEREALKATITAVSPLLGADKRLRDVVAEATGALKSEWQLPDDVAEGFTRRVEEAFQQTARSMPQGYLQGAVDKLLLEGRHYRKKTLFNEPRIRAELVCTGSEAPIPTYLPKALEMRLPLFSRFRAAMIVELRTQEDQHETHPDALVVLALARVLKERRSV